MELSRAKLGAATDRGLAAIQVDEGGARPEEPGKTEQAADLAPDKRPLGVAAARRRKTREEVSRQSPKSSRAGSKQARVRPSLTSRLASSAGIPRNAPVRRHFRNREN